MQIVHRNSLVEKRRVFTKKMSLLDCVGFFYFILFLVFFFLFVFYTHGSFGCW